MISRPLKAPTEGLTDKDIKMLQYPVIASPKLDGIRCVIVNGQALTASFKPIPNHFTRSILSTEEFHDLDGEIIVGSPYKESEDDDVFHRTSGPIRRFNGEPDFKFYTFDCFTQPALAFAQRCRLCRLRKHERLVVLEQILLRSPDDVFEYEKQKLDEGYEGIMIRLPNGSYKSGRSTYREMNIFKRKPFVSTIAVIVGFYEAMENLNKVEADEFGLTRRASNLENKVPKDTLGSLLLKSDQWDKTFSARLGKGFTAEDNKFVWDHKDMFRGSTVVVKYQKYGSKDRPRIPSVIEVEGWK